MPLPSEQRNERYRSPYDVTSMLDHGSNVSNKITLNLFENSSCGNVENVSGNTDKWYTGDTSNDTPLGQTSILNTQPLQQEDLNASLKEQIH